MSISYKNHISPPLGITHTLRLTYLASNWSLPTTAAMAAQSAFFFLSLPSKDRPLTNANAVAILPCRLVVLDSFVLEEDRVATVAF